MDAAALSEALQQSSFAAAFFPDVVRSLAVGAKWKRCPAGAAIFREGQQSDAFYVVHSGHVMLEMCLPARGCTPLLTLGPGEILAWSALVGDGLMTATATAADDVELIELSGTDLIRQCEADPLFGYRLMRRLSAALAKRLLATRLQMLDMFMDPTASPGENS